MARAAFHFLNADMTANSGNEKAWEIGETRTIEDESRINLCEFGYHSSPTLWDALQYANGPVACLVKVSKSLGSDDEPAPKNVHATRTLIKAVNIDRKLRLFAADCAERVLYIYEKDYPKDDRPRKAIQASRDFANGKIDAAAGVAARAAAWAAAWAAPGDAAGAAARAAARAAAWAAPGAAAWVAAWAAEKKWQREHFDSMFEGLFTESKVGEVES